MKKRKKVKQKSGTFSQQMAHLVSATHRLVHEMRREQRKNTKSLRKTLRQIEERLTPKEIATPKDKFIRYK